MLEILDFYADWCGPCKMMEPIIEGLIKELENKVSFKKVNVDVENEMAAKYNILSVPTYIILKDGTEVNRVIGYQSREELLQNINKHL